jgi:hypothetical protein
MNIFRSFNRTWIRNLNNEQPVYQKPVIVENGLGADLILKTIRDRRSQYPGDDFGMSVVNTTDSTGTGYHWVIVVFSRVDARVKIRVYDPLNHAENCNLIYSNAVTQGKDEFTVDIACIPLKWQGCGWRCGYYCVYAVLSAGQGQAAQDALLSEDGGSALQKMPTGFEDVIWAILRIVRCLDGRNDVREWRTFCLNFFGVQSGQADFFKWTDPARLQDKALSVVTAYKSYLSACTGLVV